ncbi:hydroxymethylbilane synthase [Ereboglobus sp. PH5-5]|uniref:hydroxymethylbilane synthase n=1 Tax=Ereboglobus sp. PH5-5 TaxID=2940529 RepID=UPI0024056371|nr:hydroxymethylbilane synthase [Ereboglobus sp. PH5-5]MDF9833341.1 hydroxymethylbilane synthase [Ereboglobus sp. PH5-5]
MKKLTLATRKSPLALAQAELVAARLRACLGVEVGLLKVVTTGDQRVEWSLEERGGKGLFTKELEHALFNGDADIAVHSTKDLPGDMPEGLAIAGYLPRADPGDVLVLRAGVTTPKTIATGSPRRRLQIAKLFPGAQFTQIRGNVDTRLRKIADGEADATILAAAGLARLRIGNWPGVEFHALGFETMVPAVGQAAIGVQCRAADAAKYAPHFDAETARHIALERAFQSALGGGCHTALGAHAARDTLWFFDEQTGSHNFPLAPVDFNNPDETARRVLARLGLNL